MESNKTESLQENSTSPQEDQINKKIDWHSIKMDYITKEISYMELAEKYAVSFSTLEKRARREQWHEEKHTYKKDLEREIKNKEKEDIANEVIEMQKKERKDFSAMEEIIWESILFVKRKNEWSPKDAHAFMSAMSKLQQMKYKNYGITDTISIQDKIDKEALEEKKREMYKFFTEGWKDD